MRRIIKNYGLIFIFITFLCACTVFIMNISGELQTMSDKFGADIMIVPAGYDPHIDNILLAAKPSASYLPENALEAVKDLNSRENLGIEKISPQVFMATLKASCCAHSVHLIGIDYGSDFIIKSWLDEHSTNTLRDGEIILGFHSTGEVGNNITFFDRDLKITGRLERTGMGLDSSVFMNRNTIIQLAEAADKIKSQKLAADKNLISVIMLKLKAGSDAPKIARIINKALNQQGIYAVFNKRFAGNISSGLVNISCVIKIFWVISLIITALLFFPYVKVLLNKAHEVKK